MFYFYSIIFTFLCEFVHLIRRNKQKLCMLYFFFFIRSCFSFLPAVTSLYDDYTLFCSAFLFLQLIEQQSTHTYIYRSIPLVELMFSYNDSSISLYLSMMNHENNIRSVHIFTYFHFVILD